MQGEGRSYQRVASHYDATYFKVDNWNAVTKGLSETEIWNINEAFLDQQVSQGKQILFSHNPLEARPKSFFEKEVNYLKAFGYRFEKKISGLGRRYPSYYRAFLVAEQASKLDIKLHLLPPYSPNLNPIERLWKVTSEHVRNSRFFK